MPDLSLLFDIYCMYCSFLPLHLHVLCESCYLCNIQPQNSIPDVFIWMLVGNKRKAYYRLPVHEIIYSEAGHNGKNCARDMTLVLKVIL